jgi:hypothetical protein
MRVLFRLLLLLVYFSIRTHRSSASLISSFTYSCTRTIENVTVPAGANYMFVDAKGSQSGTGSSGTPGYGARVQSTIAVIPGTLLHVQVGCSGASCPVSAFTSVTYPAGGYNGGGDAWGSVNEYGGTGGGGASDIRIGGLSLNHRVVVAGGGGGFYCGGSCNPKKGGDAGQFGLPGTTPGAGCSTTGTRPGGGGNWTAGGVAGYNPAPADPGPTAGTFGFGGKAINGNSGGGGGGYYGGNVSTPNHQITRFKK